MSSMPAHVQPRTHSSHKRIPLSPGTCGGTSQTRWVPQQFNGFNLCSSFFRFQLSACLGASIRPDAKYGTPGENDQPRDLSAVQVLVKA